MASSYKFLKEYFSTTPPRKSLLPLAGHHASYDGKKISVLLFKASTVSK